MTYLERIATERPEDLLAGTVPAFVEMYGRAHPTFSSRLTTRREARRNADVLEALKLELRDIWRLAHRGDERWRDRLQNMLDHWGGVDAVAATRWRLLIEHSPRPTVSAGGAS